MDAVQNMLKAVHLRPDGVMIRMSAVPGWVCLKIPNHVGSRRWTGGNLVRMGPVHSGMEGSKMESWSEPPCVGEVARLREDGVSQMEDRGPQGLPGEVTPSQLDNAISGTSANTNNIGTLDSPFGDPDMEAMRQKLNEMILNGRR